MIWVDFTAESFLVYYCVSNLPRTPSASVTYNNNKPFVHWNVLRKKVEMLMFLLFLDTKMAQVIEMLTHLVLPELFGFSSWRFKRKLHSVLIVYTIFTTAINVQQIADIDPVMTEQRLNRIPPAL